MEYQKIINFLDNTPNQPTKFRTENWVKINDDARGTYNINSKVKLKNSVLKSILPNYSDTYILVSRTITITKAGVDNVLKRVDERKKGVISKYCAPFTECISEINHIQIDNAKYRPNIQYRKNNNIFCFLYKNV